MPSWNEETAPPRVHPLASATMLRLRMRYPATRVAALVAKERTS